MTSIKWPTEAFIWSKHLEEYGMSTVLHSILPGYFLKMNTYRYQNSFFINSLSGAFRPATYLQCFLDSTVNQFRSVGWASSSPAQSFLVLSLVELITIIYWLTTLGIAGHCHLCELQYIVHPITDMNSIKTALTKVFCRVSQCLNAIPVWPDIVNQNLYQAYERGRNTGGTVSSSHSHQCQNLKSCVKYRAILMLVCKIVAEKHSKYHK
jgi:hypothetical protein